MKGVLSSVDADEASLVAKAKASPGLVGRDLVQEVTPSEPRTWQGELSQWARLEPGSDRAAAPGDRRVVALDFGMKWNIARHLRDVGCEVLIMPGTTTAQPRPGFFRRLKRYCSTFKIRFPSL